MPAPRRLQLPALSFALLLAACGDGGEVPTEDPGTEMGALPSGGSILLRGKNSPPAGATLSVTEILAIEGGSILQRIGENETTGKMQVILTDQQTIRFLENGGREIEVGEGGAELQTQFVEQEEIDQSLPDPLAGETVLAEPDGDGGWRYSLPDAPGKEVPAGFTSADLRADALYPEEYLGFNDVWRPDPQAVSALLGPRFRLRTGEVKMRLLATENVGGQRCAEVAADIEAEGTFESGGSRQDVKVRLEGKIYRSLHLYQDLKAELAGSIELRSHQGDAEVRISGPVEFRRDASWRN